MTIAPERPRTAALDASPSFDPRPVGPVGPSAPVAETAPTPIPFFDWSARSAGHVADVLAAVHEVGESDEFILKQRVATLEGLVAARAGTTHAVATSSATAGLTLALTALGIGPGDEVVTPAFSFISSASAIAHTGAIPVFADVDPETACLDVRAVEAALTDRTKAVLPAYLFTTTPDMVGLTDLSARHGLQLLEDSAVALGARVGGRPAGSHGVAGVFSFYPAKPMGGIGDAGMVVTDDDALAHRLRMLRNHGQDPSVRFVHEIIGVNARMDEITAAYLLRRLPLLDAELEHRRRLAEDYTSRLVHLGSRLRTPPTGFDGRAVYTYVVRATQRDGLRAHLTRRGIETVVYYPTPLHLQPVFAHLGGRPGDFPVAEQLARECVALPLHQATTHADVARVCDAVTEFYAGRS